MIFLVRKQLAHKILKCISPLLKHPRLPILTKYHVLNPQRTRRSNTRPFFPLSCHVETESALSLGVEHDYIHYGDGQHVFVHLEGESIGGGSEGWVDYVAVRGHAAVGRDRGVGRGVLEGEGGGELAVDCSGKADTGFVEQVPTCYGEENYPAAPGFWDREEFHRCERRGRRKGCALKG